MSEMEKLLIWLADCEAATASHYVSTKSASKSERNRHLSICETLLNGLETGYASLSPRKKESVIERLREVIHRGTL